MAVPSRRLHARYGCKVPFEVEGAKRPVKGLVVNIGMGGAFLKSEGELRLGPVKLRVTLGREVFLLDGKVLRSGPPDPRSRDGSFYGVEFSKEDRNRDKIRLLVDKVRSAGGTGISLPMTNYW